MTGDSGAAHELAAALRALRTRSGLTTRALADMVGTSPANISHWEGGERLPNEERLGKLLAALPATEEDRQKLVVLRWRAEESSQLMSGAPSIGTQLARLIEHEHVARRIIDVAPLLIPGLLQTSDYARATLVRHSDIDTRVALRVGRRDILTRTRQPVELVTYIDSEALVRPIASTHVIADQLRHLLRMAELPNVTIQLVSSMAPGYNPMLTGPFILLEFPTASSIVHVEHFQASAFIRDSEDVRGFQAAVEQIHNVAMTPADTARVIGELVNGMEPKT